MLAATLRVEFRKTRSSRVFLATTVFLVVGIAVLSGTLVAAGATGNERILAQLGPLAREGGWPLLAGTVAQITSAGALLGFGTALAWMFGREFSDGTVVGLFASPVARGKIAAAKLVVFLAWVACVAGALTLLVLVAGALLGAGPIDGAVASRLGTQFVLTLLTGLVAVPAAWVTTLTRSTLAGVASTIAIIVVGQVAVVAGVGAAAWVPMAAPALWALEVTLVSALQLTLVGAVPLAFGVLTAIAWSRLRLE